ncbi:hypothetical protein LIZ76_15780 [Caldibacillus sp. 210928-DFI.2.22]|uniref:hypothetical protein n=1 Tax=unclassified Caldibacillus TaxID=2641266 RepID=UPI001D0733F1|nr:MULTISPECIES: hypothetical protein [unclassified Caldibacillus]MCB7071385.1 hypothetical protein [Caldibacillus sp. 210928-DFI.2.22]MCB7073739.1 hypothetical protein [Caldibacillus sp. 210928-DFI.2.18]
MNENQQQNNEQQEQQQVETVAKSEYDSIVAELEEVKAKLPMDLTEEEKVIQQKQKELFDKEIQLTLKENGLEQFKDIVKVANDDELKETVKKLNKIVNNIKIEVGYVPKDNAKDNEYDVFAKNKDTKGMIATKLSKLFG